MHPSRRWAWETGLRGITTLARQVMREIDFDHLDRIAQASPERRVEAVFEMIDFAHEVSQAGRQHQEYRS